MPITLFNRFTHAPIVTVKDANTYTEAVFLASGRGVSLACVDLHQQDISGLCVPGGADLYMADLRRSDMSFSNLNGVSLLHASLDGADLYNVTGNNSEIRNVMVPYPYHVVYTHSMVQIDMNQFSYDELWAATEKYINEKTGDEDMWSWWILNRDAVYETVMNHPAIAPF